MSPLSHPSDARRSANECGSRRVFWIGCTLGALLGAIGASFLASLEPGGAPTPLPRTDPNSFAAPPSFAEEMPRNAGDGAPTVPGAASSWIVGTLSDWSGAAIEGGQVRAILEEEIGGSPVPPSSLGPGRESARQVVVATQAQGRFAILGLHAGGRYRLSAYPAPVPPRRQFDLRQDKGFPERTELVVRAPAQDVRLPLVIHRVHVDLLGPYEFLAEAGLDGRAQPITFDLRIDAGHETLTIDDLGETGFDLLVDPEQPIDLTIDNERMHPIRVRGFVVDRSQLETTLPLHVELRKTTRAVTFQVRDAGGKTVREAAVREIGLVGTETVASRASLHRERTPIGLRYSAEGIYRVSAVEEGRRMFVVTGGDQAFLPKQVIVDVPYEGEIFEEVFLERGGFLRVHMDPACARESYRVELRVTEGVRNEALQVAFVERGNREAEPVHRLVRSRVYDVRAPLPEGRYELRLHEPFGTWRSYPLQINADQVTRVDVLGKLEPPPDVFKDR